MRTGQIKASAGSCWLKKSLLNGSNRLIHQERVSCKTESLVLNILGSACYSGDKITKPDRFKGELLFFLGRGGSHAFLHAGQQLQAQSDAGMPAQREDTDVTSHDGRPKKVLDRS